MTKEYIINNLLNIKGHLKNALLKNIPETPQELYNIMHTEPHICINNNPLIFISFSKGYKAVCKISDCICNIEAKKQKYMKQSASLSKTRSLESEENKNKRKKNFINTMTSKTTIEKKKIAKKRTNTYNNRSKESIEDTLLKYASTWESKDKEEIHEINNKRKITKQVKYGDEHYNNSSKNIETRRKNNILANHIKNKEDFNEEGIKKFIKKGFFHKEECGEYFNIKNTKLCKLKKEFNITEPTFYDRVYIEDKINKIFNNSFIVRNRTIIKPLEIDLYSIKNKLAIEYNGIIWHSHGISDYTMFNNPIDKPNKHLYKTEQCEEKKIQLFHIFDVEFLNYSKKSIWISMIRDKLGLNKRIGARKCTIKEVQTGEARAFINDNHMQGYVNSKIKIGLYYNDTLVSIMTFGKPRFNKNIEYELLRFCTKKNLTIQGGGSRMLKYFENNFNPISLLSYANRRWSTGNFYEKVGFEFIEDTPPNFFYFKPEEGIMHSRIKFQKHKLKSVLPKYDEYKTATENMYINGYRKIYDSGNKKYLKKY